MNDALTWLVERNPFGFMALLMAVSAVIVEALSLLALLCRRAFQR